MISFCRKDLRITNVSERVPILVHGSLWGHFWVPIHGPYFQCYELLLIQQAANMLIIKIGELQKIPHMSFWVPILAAAKCPFS